MIDFERDIEEHRRNVELLIQIERGTNWLYVWHDRVGDVRHRSIWVLP